MKKEIKKANKYVEKAKKFIQNNYQQKITLEDVAAHVHLHSSYLGSIFKRDAGITVIEYLNIVRVDQAKSLLLNTKHPIGKIGAMCGIPDPRYFCRVFRKIVNESPHTWRKNNPEAFIAALA